MDPMPYYAPTFFSPSYFPPLDSSGVQSGGSGTGGTPSGPTLYYAPTFFSPSYFPALASSGGQGGRSGTGGTLSGSTLYYAPTFFSPYYFPPLVSSGGTTSGQGDSSGPPGYRDQNAFDAISSALMNTGEFSDVFFGNPLDQGMISAGSAPSAIVTPDRWTEYDDADPTVIVRQVFYILTLLVRDEQAGPRYDALDRLSSVAMNALDGSSLNGGCMPALTKIRQGRFDVNSRHPEQRLQLRGEFSYLIPSFTTHNTN